mmetsp:Transcript_26378/g.44082  ORF Transcript_26378/g.44082 Transcript_26378/m.44082 type:complete len:90 (-) Transcript_26378:175-444(-)
MGSVGLRNRKDNRELLKKDFENLHSSITDSANTMELKGQLASAGRKASIDLVKYSVPSALNQSVPSRASRRQRTFLLTWSIRASSISER